jgi:SAM-dependent methyltransferase
MGNESAKSNMRRKDDPLFQRVFCGRGIDIGAGQDNIARENLFPRITECETFDLDHGNAQEIARYKSPESYDFVYSSHCLEHLHNPAEALRQWFSLVKPSGHLIVVVPDEDLYEQGVFPSRFNSDHKWTFTLFKPKCSSWSPRSANLISLITENLLDFRILLMRIADTRYDYSVCDVDQTASWPGAEANIEVVIQKEDLR